MLFTLEELIYDMGQDPEKRILFVEGNRDLAFWRDIVPTLERGNTVVYPISSIEGNDGEGGEKGKIIRCAEILILSEVVNRVHFFADADSDRVLEVLTPKNVTLTDGRDLESYTLNEICLKKLWLSALAKGEDTFNTLINSVIPICRLIGYLRVASDRNTWKLPFQRTMNKGIKRFVDRERSETVLHKDYLVSVLIQNTIGERQQKSKVIDEWISEQKKLSSLDDWQIIHGKDFISFLSFAASVTDEHIEHLLFGCLEVA